MDRPAAVASVGTVGAPPWLVLLARQVAAVNGHAHPARAHVVMTTRQRAIQVHSGRYVDSNQATYFVVLRGRLLTRMLARPIIRSSTGL